MRLSEDSSLPEVYREDLLLRSTKTMMTSMRGEDILDDLDDSILT